MGCPHAVLKKLESLNTTLITTSGLPAEEITIVLERAGKLLHKSYMIKGVQSLVKNIIKSKGDRNLLLNHLVHLNLVYHLLEVKNKAVGVERKVRPDSNKRVDIMVFGEKDLYIEIKNVNEPELVILKDDFADKIRLPLSRINYPYFIHFRFFRPQMPKLSQENFQPLVERIKEELEKEGGQGWIAYPSQKSASLSFSLEKSPLPFCSLGRYGFGERWPYCLYSEEYLENLLEKETKASVKSIQDDMTRTVHERNIRRYKFLKDNSDSLVELELKHSVLRGIKDSELKFPTPSAQALNVIALHFSGQQPPTMADIVADDLVRWYYSSEEGRNRDKLWEYYELWAEEERFHRLGKIDAFVSLSGKGIKGPYSWKIIYARWGKKELEEILP